MRYPHTVAGVHGANDIFPGFFRGEKFEKHHLNVEKNQNILQPGMFFVETGSHVPPWTLWMYAVVRMYPPFPDQNPDTGPGQTHIFSV